MKVKDFLKIKGRSVITIGPDETIHTAIQKLVENNIGALPVCDAKGTMVGIVSERDLLRECGQCSDAKKTKIKDVMTAEVVIGVLEDNLDFVMNTMMQKGIRHIPIMDGAKLVNIISARDIIEERLEECQVDVRNLNDYISGGYI
jgi:CBS domain-containing protein